MKHTAKVTLVLMAIFLLAQFTGLAIVNQYIDSEATAEAGETVYKDLPMNMDRPDVPAEQSFIFIMAAIIIGTILVLILIKLKGAFIWKAWFFLAATICLTMAFGAFINEYLAIILAIILAGFKVYRPNIYIHNLTEIFLYGGLAAIFVPIMDIFAAVILLLLISAYDMYAVWKSKHMVTMAKFQSESKVFAGLLIPYSLKKSAKVKKTVKKGMKKISVPTKNAILGGGDIGFPLLFAGVLMKTYGIWKVMVIPLTAALALFILFMYAKKDKFYPAMPFVTAGCFLGYLIVWLL